MVRKDGVVGAYKNGKKANSTITTENSTTTYPLTIGKEPNSAEFFNGIISIVSALLGITLTFIISAIISRKLSQIIKVSNKIASGNLKVESIDYSGKDEIAELSKATKAMRERLQSMIQEISTVSNVVSHKSNELSITSAEVKAAANK